MTVRMFLVGSLLALLVGTTAWVGVVNYLDPGQAGWIGLVLFFLSFFTSLFGILSLVGYGLRRVFARRQFPAYAVRVSLRQGVVIALFAVALLVLQFFRLYQWWLIVLLIVLFISLELVFLSYDRANRRHVRSIEE